MSKRYIRCLNTGKEYLSKIEAAKDNNLPKKYFEGMEGKFKIGFLTFETFDKKDCFAYNKSYCRALNEKQCCNCAFYRNDITMEGQVMAAEKYLNERMKNVLSKL